MLPVSSCERARRGGRGRAGLRGGARVDATRFLRGCGSSGPGPWVPGPGWREASRPMRSSARLGFGVDLETRRIPVLMKEVVAKDALAWVSS